MFIQKPLFGIPDDADWELAQRSLIYRSKVLGMDIHVPVGFKTDLASIPRLFRPFFKVNGKHRYAAVVHDFLYYLKGVLPEGIELSRKKADKVFLEAMKDSGVGWFKRNSMYAAVRSFGFLSY